MMDAPSLGGPAGLLALLAVLIVSGTACLVLCTLY